MAVTQQKTPVTGAGPFNGVLTWVDARFPLVRMWKEQLSEYYAPKNFNWWYYFGSLALLCLVIQIVSGIFLTMNYKPSAQEAFASVEYITGRERAIKPEYFVCEGVCTHLGCSPTLKKEIGAASDMGADWPGGYYCPCHNSRFDLAARVFKGSPAPKNLVIPPHRYVSDAVVVIGEDTKGA